MDKQTEQEKPVRLLLAFDQFVVTVRFAEEGEPKLKETVRNILTASRRERTLQGEAD